MNHSSKPGIAILHYSASPIIGGVEAVIDSHGKQFVQNGYPVTVIAGRGEAGAMPEGVEFYNIPLMDSQAPVIKDIGSQLEEKIISPLFYEVKEQLVNQLAFALSGFDIVMVHNVFTKHFNLPLTAALAALKEQYPEKIIIAWCHDFSWTRENTRDSLHNGYPWDLLRSKIPEVKYVTISQARAGQLAGLFCCEDSEIKVIENGVDPDVLLGLSEPGMELCKRFDLLEQDVNIIMPIRITQAKNIEFALQVTAAMKHMGLKVRLVVTGPPGPHSTQGMMYYNSLRKMRQSLDVEQEACFVFETGEKRRSPVTIDMQTVGDLYRVCDVLLLPSHREGFGMSVLEAGLLGMPSFVSGNVPSAVEIGGSDITLVELEESPKVLAQKIINLSQTNPQCVLKRRIRQNYTWDALFKKKIEPLFSG